MVPCSLRADNIADQGGDLTQYPPPTTSHLSTRPSPAGYQPTGLPAHQPTILSIPSRRQPSMTLSYPPTSLPAHPFRLYLPSPPIPKHYPQHPSEPLGVVAVTSSEVPEDHLDNA